MSTAPLTWSYGRFLGEGAWRFLVVSLAGFSPWAFAGGWLHGHVGEAGLYAVCTLGFLLAATLLLPALLQPRSVWRLQAFFVPAFLAYAVIWCACWFSAGSPWGEWLGVLAGGGAFVLITAWRLGRPRALVVALLVFIAAHAGGYFAGGAAMHVLADGHHPGVIGMLAWGACHGLGFGLGLGHLLHACQNARRSAAAV